MRMVFDDMVFEVDEKELKTIFMKYLSNLGKRHLNESKLNLLRNRSFVTGMLHDNAKVEEVPSELMVRIIFEEEYGPFVEYGTGPHPVSRKGIENLTEWAAIKFGLTEKEARNRAYAVANGIRKKGTRPHPFTRPATELLVSGNLPGGEI